MKKTVAGENFQVRARRFGYILDVGEKTVRR